MDPDFRPPCELTGAPADDIHHIECRGMGGSKGKDHIGNLMALTREMHEQMGDNKQYKEFLQMVHDRFMQTRLPYFKEKRILNRKKDGNRTRRI